MRLLVNNASLGLLKSRMSLETRESLETRFLIRFIVERIVWSSRGVAFANQSPGFVSLDVKTPNVDSYTINPEFVEIISPDSPAPSFPSPFPPASSLHSRSSLLSAAETALVVHSYYYSTSALAVGLNSPGLPAALKTTISYRRACTA